MGGAHRQAAEPAALPASPNIYRSCKIKLTTTQLATWVRLQVSKGGTRLPGALVQRDLRARLSAAYRRAWKSRHTIAPGSRDPPCAGKLGHHLVPPPAAILAAVMLGIGEAASS